MVEKPGNRTLKVSCYSVSARRIPWGVPPTLRVVAGQGLPSVKPSTSGALSRAAILGVVRLVRGVGGGWFGAAMTLGDTELPDDA